MFSFRFNCDSGVVWGLVVLVEGLILFLLVVGLLEDWGVLKIVVVLKNEKGKYVCMLLYFVLV